MNGFLLDTSTLSYILDVGSLHHQASAVRFGVESQRAKVGLSVLTLYEISLVTERLPAIAAAMSYVRRGFEIVALPMDGAGEFQKLKTGISDRWGVAPRTLGRHNVDLMIAATALTLDRILVSNDSIFRDLAAIEPRLTVEDWTA